MARWALPAASIWPMNISMKKSASVIGRTAASGWKAELISLMLVPAMSVSLLQRDERKQGVSPLLAVGILGLGAAAVVSGSLNQSRAAGLVNPLYEYSKSVTLLGSVKGLEAVVSCALTAGWFVVLSLLISAAGNAVYGEIEKRYRKAVWGSGLVAALTVLWGIGDPNMEAVIAGVIWVVLPLIMGVQKKLKKQKNSA